MFLLGAKLLYRMFPQGVKLPCPKVLTMGKISLSNAPIAGQTSLSNVPTGRKESLSTVPKEDQTSLLSVSTGGLISLSSVPTGCQTSVSNVPSGGQTFLLNVRIGGKTSESSVPTIGKLFYQIFRQGVHYNSQMFNKGLNFTFKCSIRRRTSLSNVQQGCRTSLLNI